MTDSTGVMWNLSVVFDKRIVGARCNGYKTDSELEKGE